MNPITGALDASDLLRQMKAWLFGNPQGAPSGYVQGEMQLQQALSDQARLDAIARISARSYPGLEVARGGTSVSTLVDPWLPYWRALAELEPGPTTRASGQDTLLYVRIRLGISNSPVSLSFTVDPTMPEATFRALMQSQYALIAAQGVPQS